MKPTSKKKLYRVLFIAGMLLVMLGLVYGALEEVAPGLVPLIRAGNPDAIQDYVLEEGAFQGILCIALLQMVQVWSVFISGIPIQVAAGALYGVGIGFLICHAASTIAFVAAFVLWRRLGKQMEKWFPLEEKDQSRLQMFLTEETPPEYTVLVACLVPVMPNGLVPLLASKLPIRLRTFIPSVIVGNIFNVIICVCLGNELLSGHWVVGVSLLLAMFAVVWLMWRFRIEVYGAIEKVKNAVWKKKRS